MPIHNPSRRTVLRGLLAAGCVLYIPRSSPAETGKVGKAQAQYQDQPKGDQNCANCTQFVAPNSCKLVEGSISPTGWCRLWAKKQG
jgi:hypothetical protein